MRHTSHAQDPDFELAPDAQLMFITGLSVYEEGQACCDMLQCHSSTQHDVWFFDVS